MLFASAHFFNSTPFSVLPQINQFFTSSSAFTQLVSSEKRVR